MVMRVKDRRIGRICVAVAALSLAGAPAHAITLEEAVRAALKTNPQIGTVIENRRAVDHELSQARSGFFPTVDFSTSSGKEYVNNATTRGRELDGNDSRTTGLPTTDVTLSIRQLLFDGFDVLSQVERQEARVRSAARRVRETAEFIGVDAGEAYLESLRQRELMRINDENIRAHEVFLELIRAKVAGGAAGRAEEEQAQQRVAGARDAQTQADGLKRDADVRFRRIVGEEPITMVRPTMPVQALPPTIERAIELAVLFNPTIRVSRAEVAISEAELKQSKSSQWPQLSFEVNANSNRNTGGSRGHSSTLSALLVMNYNLYRGGADVARRHEFLARLAEARQRLAQSQRDTDENTRVAWNALVNARERLVQLRAIVETNVKIHDDFKKQFDIGRKDLLDLLNAENDYHQARSNMTSQEFVEMLGVYRILGTTGLLLTTLDVAPVAEAFMNDAESSRFEYELQRFVERTPVLDTKPEKEPKGPGAPPGTPPAAPLGPSPLLVPPTQGQDLMSPAGQDLMSPVGGPVLDPNAPVTPIAPTPPAAKPKGADKNAGPTSLLPRQARLESAGPRTGGGNHIDRPRLGPRAPLGFDQSAARRIPPPAGVDNPTAQTSQDPVSKAWWFGPTAPVPATTPAKPTKAPTPRRPAAWGFD